MTVLKDGVQDDELSTSVYSETGGFDWFPGLATSRPTVAGGGGGSAGSWVQIVAAGILPDPAWIIGAVIEAVDIDEYFLEFGTGGIGSEAEVDPDVRPFLSASSVGDAAHYLNAWPPRRINGSPRLVVRTVNAGSVGNEIEVRIAVGEDY